MTILLAWQAELTFIDFFSDIQNSYFPK